MKTDEHTLFRMQEATKEIKNIADQMEACTADLSHLFEKEKPIYCRDEDIILRTLLVQTKKLQERKRDLRFVITMVLDGKGDKVE